MELAGQVALVTGGGRGIGAGIARELTDAGMRVAVSARTREQVDEVADEVGGLGVQADVSQREDVERMVAEVERELGRSNCSSPTRASATVTRVSRGRSTSRRGGACTR